MVERKFIIKLFFRRNNKERYWEINKVYNWTSSLDELKEIFKRTKEKRIEFKGYIEEREEDLK